MLRITILLLLFFYSLLSIAQIKLVKLEVNKNEKYFIEGSETLEADTIIMKDSSEIVLNSQTRDNIIRAKVISVGMGCQIIGRGSSSKNGKEGTVGKDQSRPCTIGNSGGNGSAGAHGSPGNNLFLYFNELQYSDPLTINLTGGVGGDGGEGGRGGSGGPGTRVCAGGTGGVGGNGGIGGNGGEGGTLSIQCKHCPSVRALINKAIIVKNYGGHAGWGGEGGTGGSGGLGPIKDGPNGKLGKIGKDGVHGKNGVINFLSN